MLATERVVGLGKGYHIASLCHRMLCHSMLCPLRLKAGWEVSRLGGLACVSLLLLTLPVCCRMLHSTIGCSQTPTSASTWVGQPPTAARVMHALCVHPQHVVCILWQSRSGLCVHCCCFIVVVLQHQKQPWLGNFQVDDVTVRLIRSKDEHTHTQG